jgi:hypothetical protein
MASCASFSSIADEISKMVEGFAGTFKLETFKKQLNHSSTRNI